VENHFNQYKKKCGGTNLDTTVKLTLFGALIKIITKSKKANDREVPTAISVE
jgi:hypothetical protein